MNTLTSPNHKSPSLTCQISRKLRIFLSFPPKIFLRITGRIRLVYQSAPVLPACGHPPGEGISTGPWRLGTSKPAWPSPGLAGSWCWGPADGQEKPWRSWIHVHFHIAPCHSYWSLPIFLSISFLWSGKHFLSASRYGSLCLSKFPLRTFSF